jgi:arylsulfatase A-like enzyme
MSDKFHPHQESIRVPLLIRDPRMALEWRNTTNDALTLNVDLAATILSAANVPVPDYYQGRDVSELYLQKPYMVRPWRTEFFYEFPGLHGDWVPASQALVRKEHKYMLWTEHDYEQLFDLIQDPMEDHDVFREEAYQTIIHEMKERFLELRLAAR